MPEDQTARDWLTIEEVAKRLQINHNTVRSYIAKKELRATKIGRYWRITDGDLQAFVAKRANMDNAAA